MLRGRLDYAFLMEADAVASTRDVLRVLKEAPCFVRHMVAGSVAYLLDAPKVLKGAHRFARGMVGENAASLMVVGSAQKVYTEAQIFVLPMVVEKDVPFPAAPRVHVAALIVVLSMVEGSGASLKTVERVPKVAQTSAKLMVGESDAAGEKENVRNLQGERVVYVLHTVAWFRSGRQRKEV